MAVTPHTDCTLDEYYPYDDKELPQTFVQKRHFEAIEGVEVVAETWRMKERVRYYIRLTFHRVLITPYCALHQIFVVLSDENRQCSSNRLPKHRRGSSGYRQDSAMCSYGMLDR